MANLFIFDESKWPLLIITVPAQPDDNAFNDYFAKMDKYLKRNQRCGVLFDASATTNVQPQHRLQQSAWLKANQSVLQRYCVGSAFVMKSTLIRGMLQAVLLFAPMPYPHTVVASIDEATNWLMTRLQPNAASNG